MAFMNKNVRVNSIDEQVRVVVLEMFGEVATVKNVAQFGPAVLSVRAKILIELAQAFEFGVFWCTLMSVRCGVHNSDCSAF